MNRKFFSCLLISIIVIEVISCTKEEPPAPLPPPVRQIEPPLGDKRRENISHTIGNELLKKEAFSNQQDPALIGSDCNSICSRIIECIKDYGASKIFNSLETCLNRCNMMSDIVKSAITRSKDCSFVRCNINRYLCDIACKESARCNNGNIPKQMGSNMVNCLKGCMDMFHMNDRVSKVLNCFSRSNECENISNCIEEDISPPNSVEEYCKQ